MTRSIRSQATKPQGRYVIAKRRDDLIFTAGMTPRRNGVLILEGPVSSNENPEYYRQAFVLACANALDAARTLISTDEVLCEVVSMTVFIAADTAFRGHSQFADYASEYLYEQLGENGICVRAAVGVATLPSGAPVEIQLVMGVNRP
jgi:enamine deaminase RidA (YjgF/YER057c/UK114 family)